MFIACWSVKGGCGTTVVAVAHALHVARRVPRVLLVDLAGDAAAALGLAEPAGPGVGEWLGGGGRVPLFDLAVPAGGRLSLLHPGLLPGDAGGEMLAEQLASLSAPGTATAVVVDCGVPGGSGPEWGWALAAGADRSLLVLRPCYLALRRAVAAPVRPSAVVFVRERERVLQERDVEDVLGVPVTVSIPWDPVIARAVDAGLLATRVPRLLDRALGTEAAA